MLDPDLANQIEGILSYFREKKVHFMANIESMVYQSKIVPDHRSYLRFYGGKTVTLKKKSLTLKCVHGHFITIM